MGLKRPFEDTLSAQATAGRMISGVLLFKPHPLNVLLTYAAIAQSLQSVIAR